MALDTQALEDQGVPGIKRVPHERDVRAAVRRAAVDAAAGLPADCSPSRADLERQAEAVLERVGLPHDFLGFAMVAVSNAFWRAAYRGVPFGRRLLLLPKCLSDSSACAAPIDSVGLQCAGCGACSIDTLKPRAEALGYQVVVAEGTSSVLMKVLDGDADAILGVACLDSLERSFARVVDLGIPHLAVPLLSDGCADTEAEIEEILALLLLHGGPAASVPHTYVPLLRESVRLFSETAMPGLLEPHVGPGGAHPLVATDAVALAWLRKGGKRLRPFVTLAAYAVARHGTAALAADAEVEELVPLSVRRVALAIEALHKASLVHDDIEDEDAFRYGEPTLHRTHGVASALNVGDLLIGLGYRLVAGEAPALGAECIAGILGDLSAAHLDLCRGQGAELLWKHRPGDARPRDILEVYALKTSPAFEVALAAGLRAAGIAPVPAALKPFSIYLGEGYQILNDLEDWEGDGRNKVSAGQDALSGRPTLVHALAVQAGAGARLGFLTGPAAAESDPSHVLAEVRDLYVSTGALAGAGRFLDQLRERALRLAGEVEPPALRELLAVLVRVVLEKQERA